MNCRALICLLFLVRCSQAATYYVATNGNNSNIGSQGSPWLTIAKAASTIVAGDTVRVQPGNYAEFVTEGTSGTAGSPLIYMSEIPLAATNRGWRLDGHDIRVIGFNITSGTDLGTLNNIGVDVVNSNCWVIDNYIHKVDSFGMRISIADGSVIRGNTIIDPGFQFYPTNVACVLGSVVSSRYNTNIVCEYNTMSYGSDFFNPAGRDWVIRNNSIGPSYSNATVHIDFVQGGATNILIENNWLKDNLSSDNHFLLTSTLNETVIARGNVLSFSMGGVGWNNAPNLSFYHNTWFQSYPYNDVLTIVSCRFNSTNNVSRNNIWSYAVRPTTGLIYAITDTSTIDRDYELLWQSGDASETHQTTADPLFTATNTFNYRLLSGSPARGIAGPLTVAIGAGVSSTSLTCNFAGMFWPGDTITVGGTSVQISSINIPSSVITLTAPASWSNGATILWEGRTDNGGFPYGSSELTSATISTNGTTYTVTPTGDARMVWFYVDGIPTTQVTNAPYSATIASGTVTAKAYALYAQAIPVVTATSGGGSGSVATSTFTGNATLTGNILIR